MKLGSPLVLMAVALAMPHSGVSAQAPDLFNQAVDVRVVNVDVHVTDRKGRPVLGLGRDDFTLYLDGRPVEITYFRAPRPGAEPSAGIPPAPAAGASVPARGEAAHDDLLVVLYLDNSWLMGADRDRLVGDLQTFVAEQPPGKTRFLVATGDPGLSIRAPITSDIQSVRAALDSVADTPTHGLEATRERSSAFRAIQTIYESYRDTPFCTPCECGWEQMVATWEVLAQNVTNRMQVSQRGLSDLVAALSGVPDRKAVIYVASGLEQRPALDVLQYLSELCPLRQRDAATRLLTYDESQPLLTLGAQANAGRTTFYPLDAGGIRADSAASIEWADAKFRPSGLITRIERENYQASLQMLASETGGQAIVNANHPLDRLRALEDDFENSYSLGLEPPGEADGRTHDLRVELRERSRGADVRYRRSFVDRPLERRLVDRAIAAISFGEERNPLAVEASLGETSVLARNVISVPVQVAVRPQNLILVPAAEGGVTGRFRVFLAARATSGARTVLRDRFFDLDPTEAASDVLRLVVNMNLEPGDYTVAVGVRDELGDVTSYLILDTTDPSDRKVAEAPTLGDAS